jgi:hypothetical protein
MTGCQILITNNVSCNVQSQLVGKYIFCIHLGGGGALVNVHFSAIIAQIFTTSIMLSLL